MVFEILDGAFVGFRRLSSSKRAQISPAASLRVLLSRVEAVLAGFEFPNHRYPSAGRRSLLCGTGYGSKAGRCPARSHLSRPLYSILRH
jgi:hypothetical protein